MPGEALGFVIAGVATTAVGRDKTGSPDEQRDEASEKALLSSSLA